MEQLATLTEIQARLVGALDGLIHQHDAGAGTAPVELESPAGSAACEVTLSAGPFSAISELREFERALSELPGVRAVTVRGYEGSDRVIIDVGLERASSSDPTP
jgi:hypothetical protein